MRDFSIIIPVYFNEGCLTSVMEALRATVLNREDSLRGEIIFVDDGSGDGSYAELLRIQQASPNTVTVIKLTRNFGQASAIIAGMAHSCARCGIIISADGQDPPGLINEMLASHFQERHEIVICTRAGREESAYRVITSRLFYELMKKLTFANMPRGGFDLMLMGRKALDVFLRNRDAHPFFQGQVLWMGFGVKFIQYHRRARLVGRSRWTFGKKITYLIDGVLAYSFLPLRAMSLLGFFTAFLGFLYAAVVFLARLAYGNPVQGWTPIMVAVLMIGGVQMLMLGVIGEYLWRTLAQVRNRDLYVIDQIVPAAGDGEEEIKS